MPLGVAPVHPEQLRGEQRGLLAAGAGADLDDDVPVVVRDRAAAAGRAAVSTSFRLLGARSSSTISRAISRSSGSVSVARECCALSSCFAHALAAPVVVDDRRQLGLLAAQLRGYASGSAATSGRDHSASISSRRRSSSSRRCSRLIASAGRAPGSAGEHRPWSGIGRRSGSRLPAGASSPFAASASRIDAMATSIIESSGCLVVMRLQPDAGQEQPADPPLVAVPGAEAQDLVRDRGDDRDEQDPADDADQQALARQQAEQQDADDDEDDQELGAAARMSGRVVADVLDRRAGPRARARGWSCAPRRGTGRRAGSPPTD